ncbi:MAG: YceI family protein [Cytophagales bacterium]|nr:YceI family protein [Cytophagales bacterium]
MRRCDTIFLFLLAGVLPAAAQTLKPVAESSAVQFKIKNFGTNCNGTFTGLEGTIVFDPAQPAAAKFDMSVDANSVDTNIGLRDNHLRKEEYFDVATYARIRFVSTAVTASSPGKYTMTGNLTIKTTTKSISFPFTYTSSSGVSVFEGEFPLNRRDYKVGGGSFSLSDNLTVQLKVTAR